MRGDCVVVGGCGLVGRAIVPRLIEEGRRVVVIDQAIPAMPCLDVVYHVADVRDPDALLRLASICPREAWVINLAARQYGDGPVPRRGRQRYFSVVNVDGALHVSRLAVAINAAGLVQFSTDMVYDRLQNAPRDKPAEEDFSRRPIGEYGKSKALMEQQLREFARVHSLPATVFRPHLIIGPGRLGVFDKLFSLIRRHLPIPLFGSGRNFYPIIAAEDCAAAIQRALASGCPCSVYNLGIEPSWCVRDLLRKLCRELGSRSFVFPLPAAFLHATLRSLAVVGIEPLYPEQYLPADKTFVLDASKARRELDWSPRHSDSLSLLIECYQCWEKLSART